MSFPLTPPPPFFFQWIALWVWIRCLACLRCLVPLRPARACSAQWASSTRSSCPSSWPLWGTQTQTLFAASSPTMRKRCVLRHFQHRNFTTWLKPFFFNNLGTKTASQTNQYNRLCCGWHHENCFIHKLTKQETRLPLEWECRNKLPTVFSFCFYFHMSPFPSLFMNSNL